MKKTKLALILAAFATTGVSADVVRVDIDASGEVAGGSAYGLAGAFERYAGTRGDRALPQTH